MTNNYNDYTMHINADVDLTGTWLDQDGNTFYLNHKNENVWMLGLSADDGASWVSTFVGTANNNQLVGTLTDIPNGLRTDVTNIVLQIADDGQMLTSPDFFYQNLVLTKV